MKTLLSFTLLVALLGILAVGCSRESAVTSSSGQNTPSGQSTATVSEDVDNGGNDIHPDDGGTDTTPGK